MISNGQPLWRDVIIINELGLHARSAALLAKAARKAAGGVWIRYAGEQIDAKQILDILTLGAARGSSIRIGVERVEDLDTLTELVRLVDDGFGE